MKKLGAANARILCNKKICRITDGGVETEPVDGGEKEFVKADAVIAAFGTKPVNRLAALFEDRAEVMVIGDAKAPDTITAAIHDGFFAALDI